MQEATHSLSAQCSQQARSFKQEGHHVKKLSLYTHCCLCSFSQRLCNAKCTNIRSKGSLPREHAPLVKDRIRFPLACLFSVPTPGCTVTQPQQEGIFNSIAWELECCSLTGGLKSPWGRGPRIRVSNFTPCDNRYPNASAIRQEVSADALVH